MSLLDIGLGDLLRPTPTDVDALGLAYDDVAEIPEDPTPEFPDGDDSIHGIPGTTTLGFAQPLASVGLDVAPKANAIRKPFPVVLPRELHWKDSGNAVRAMQRGLRAGDWRKLGPTGTYYRPTVRQVEAFKRSKHLLTHNGKVFGQTAHKAMLPHYDAFDGWLMAHDEESIEKRARQALVASAYAFFHAAPRVRYTQSPMRMQTVRTRDRLPLSTGYIWEDCSSLVTACYWHAELPDPNGLGFNGQGYTGTLAQHGWSVSLAGAKPGDLVFYGNGAPWGHVAMYVGGDRVISFGSDPGPYLLNVDYRGDRGLILSYVR